MTRRARVAGVAAAVVAATTFLASGQAGSTAAPPEIQPAIWIFSGGSGGGTSNSLALGDGTWQETLVWAGGSSPDLCTAGTMSPQPGPTAPALPPWAGRPLVTWRLAFRLQAFDGQTATIEVRWRRDVEEGASLQPAVGYDGTFTWRASEGDSRVLDLVRQVPAARPGCDSQAITLEYKAIGPDELREAAIAYDLWLVQRLPSGDTHTRRLQATGRQDDAVLFGFPAVAIDAPGGVGTPVGATLDVTVQGQIRGRVRRDGRLDIAVDAGRLVMARGLGPGLGASGRTHLTVVPGETVELEPPPMSVTGSSSGAHYAAALQDARTAIRVRARRLW
jgi:hypothetical protein